MARRHEDATPWVGYADFLTTLAMLFLLIIVAAAAHRKRQAGFVLGTVTGVASQGAITSCLARLGTNRQQRTDAQGEFEFRIDAIVEAVTIPLDVRCPGYGVHSELLTIASGDTIRRTIRLRRDSAITIVRLPGDALFGSSSYKLTTEGIGLVESTGRALKVNLQPGEIVVVQGHTDDLPFPAGAGIDNWVLSGERAAAAAKILTDPRYGIAIRECQVAIMGFGPSQPVERVRDSDGRKERARKRALNRRIEFRKLRGGELTSSSCDAD